MKNYTTVISSSVDEITINKSRFIGYSKNVKTQGEAEDFIAKINKKHYDATHNCYAYILGEDKIIQKQSDDGEPSGTAGFPILEVINKRDLTNVVIVVTRYFGGIKLGAGGLIRAYTKGANIAIESNTIVQKIVHIPIDVEVDYTFVGKIQNFLSNKDTPFKPPTFLDKVTFHIYVKNNDKDSFVDHLNEITGANYDLTVQDPVYLTFEEGKCISF